MIALIAEFLPVELSRRSVRITFTLPYVAGMAAAVGPLGALLTDASTTLVAGLAYVAMKRQRTIPIWVAANTFVAVIACAFASLVMTGVLRGVSLDGYREPLSALAFLITYGIVNFILVTYLDNLSSGRRFYDNVMHSLRLGVASLALYAIVALAVSVFVEGGMVWMVPLTLVPIWALRTGLAYQAQMYDHYYETITALTLMLQRAHPYTHGHTERVAEFAEEVARRLGLSRRRARLVREAAVLHDIGKIAVDEQILDQPRKLTDQELAHVRRHPVCGAQILAPVKQFHEMVPWIRYHHERPDGTGYPDQLTDVEIPIESKIIAVVDAYDAMTGSGVPGQQRSYRAAMSQEEAVTELRRCAGTQFDARVVAAFAAVVAGSTI